MMLKKSKNEHHGHEHNHNHDHSHNEIKKKSYWIKVALLLLPYLYYVVLNVANKEGATWTEGPIIKYTWHWGIWLSLTSYIVFWEGRRYLKIYWKLIKFKVADMDLLIGLAGHILYLYSFVQAMIHVNDPMFSYDQMWEGTAVLYIATNIGHGLEGMLRKNATESYEKLSKMKNSVALKLEGKKYVQTHVSELKVGDLVVIKKGEMVVIDGLIQSKGTFDYSNITGESKKILLDKNMEVLSGAYNLSDAILIKVSKISDDSTISKIVDKIEDATLNKPSLQRIADKLLKWFIPSVLSASLITFIIWSIVGYTTDFKFPWINSSDSAISNAIKAGVTVIAIACPCSLGIAVPMVNMVTVSHSTKIGLLLNNPAALEEVRHIKYIAFDKTGTITNENLKVSKTFGNDKLIGVAKALEAKIKHPIASAILDLKGNIEKVSNIKNETNGVSGSWKNKKVEIRTLDNKDVSKEMDLSQTLVGLYVSNKLELTFSLTNEVKKGVAKVIKKLHKSGYKVIMITGDSKHVANHVAKQVGIDKVFAETKPHEKAGIIKNLQKENKLIFIGDGFNDAIAIKQANVSVAFATGSNITNDIADISIANNRFDSIYKLMTLSKINNRFIKMSLGWAISFNLITIPVAILLLVQPWMGAMIMATSDVFIVLGALIYKKIGMRKLGKINDSI